MVLTYVIIGWKSAMIACVTGAAFLLNVGIANRNFDTLSSKCDNSTLVVFSDHGVRFPVA
jgi:hypothetical protein